MPAASYRITGEQQTMPEGEFLLPLCITIPRATKLLNALNTYRNLTRDDDFDVIIDTLQALAYVQTPEQAPCAPCSDPEAQCISFYPNHPNFEFSPGVVNGGTTNPPPGYVQHPFFTGNNYTVPGFNLLPTDVVSDLFSIGRPGTNVIQIITEGGFPRFRFNWTGAATIELHLIGVPLGGIAIARVDDGAEVDIYDLASVTPSDLDLSVATILQLIEGVAETNFVPVTIHEITVDGDGEHYVDVLFAPTIELSLNPIGWGGGVRKVVVCGTEVSCEDQVCPDCPPVSPDCDECDDCGESPCSDCEEC